MNAVLTLSTALFLIGAGTAVAADISSPIDPRIRNVDYVAEGVIAVPVSRGVVTRIVLERGEKIIAAATGVPSKCDNDTHVWCVVADADTNEVWVKPKAGATHNNLELKTDRRDYSIDLRVGTEQTYRVVIRYPQQAGVNGMAQPSEQDLVADRLKAAQPEARNLNYTVEPNLRGGDITPKAVFDDGNFTYFKFPGNSELPTVFVIGADGKEARVNFNMEGDFIVVQRLGRKFVLRLGKSVVSVWNESFDPKGVAPVGGTTVVGVSRENVGGQDGN
jgi:type IV secretion system protein VirB9